MQEMLPFDYRLWFSEKSLFLAPNGNAIDKKGNAFIAEPWLTTTAAFLLSFAMAFNDRCSYYFVFPTPQCVFRHPVLQHTSPLLA
ncbi:MAG TPA: hypothetical protein VFT06_10165 [Flavisolibacter sp.]|nr:hypothetical protein [Flavisolibacter sp.]